MNCRQQKEKRLNEIWNKIKHLDPNKLLTIGIIRKHVEVYEFCKPTTNEYVMILFNRLKAKKQA